MDLILSQFSIAFVPEFAFVAQYPSSDDSLTE